MDALSIVATYVVLDDSLKALGHRDDGRAQITSAEVLTVAVLAARYFQNHHERALSVLQQIGAIGRLSVSRFNRRLHACLRLLRRLLRHLRHTLPPAPSSRVCIDAMPLPLCKRVRQRQCRKAHGERFVGRCEAKREWFFGYKLHWCCDARGLPIAFTLRPARRHERSAVSLLLSATPVGSTVLGDAAYVNDARAAVWAQRGRRLIAKRYGRMSSNTPEERRLLAHRQVIEVAHSQLESMGIQRLRARTRGVYPQAHGCLDCLVRPPLVILTSNHRH